MADAARSSPSIPDYFWNEAWREFLCGGVAAGIGESLMHPVDTVKTRMQSGGSFISTVQESTRFTEVLKLVLKNDGSKGLYRGIAAGMTGSFASGATYFGLIELSRSWINQRHPELASPISHFCAGALGDTIGSVVYVPCEVIKQRMQIQGSLQSWEARMAKSGKPLAQEVEYYKKFSHAAISIVQQEGIRGLFSGFASTIGRDVPFAGLMIMLYEGIAEIVKSGKDPTNARELAMTGFEDLVIGGAAGGFSAFLTTPLDVIKTRLQVQGSVKRYRGWRHAMENIWENEGFFGFWKGSLPRVMWYLPASAFTFMIWQGLRNLYIKPGMDRSSSLGIERNTSPSVDTVVT